MKFSRFLLLSLAAILPLFAQVSDVDRKDNQDDMDALRRWLRDKRFVTVKELGGDLAISGEVRTELQDTAEKKNGIRQRGDGGATTKPQYAWDVEVNLMIDYRTDRAWAAAKLEFDDDMGSQSGTFNKIRLEKAYLGGRIIAGETFTTDAEIGRRFLSNVFESKLEFASLFDGLVFRFSKAWPEIGDYYFNTGAFIVDDKLSQYGYVAEMGGLRVGNIGLNLKYSVIDWYKPFANEWLQRRYDYVVSQFLSSYIMYPNWLGNRLIKFYAAGLCNHLASGVPQTNYTKQNFGWYAGFSLGLVKKQGDWAIDCNYQWLQAQAVPSFDVSGISRGNAADVGFYTASSDGNPSSGITTNKTAVGAANYKGFEIEALYAFTDNITVQQNYKMSWTLNKNIGPDISYKQYEVEFIYAF